MLNMPNDHVFVDWFSPHCFALGPPYRPGHQLLEVDHQKGQTLLSLALYALRSVPPYRNRKWRIESPYPDDQGYSIETFSPVNDSWLLRIWYWKWNRVIDNYYLSSRVQSSKSQMSSLAQRSSRRFAIFQLSYSFSTCCLSIPKQVVDMRAATLQFHQRWININLQVWSVMAPIQGWVKWTDGTHGISSTSSFSPSLPGGLVLHTNPQV